VSWCRRHLRQTGSAHPSLLRLCGLACPKRWRRPEKREHTIYGTTDAEDIAEALDSYREFIELCERKVRETGEVPDNCQLLTAHPTCQVGFRQIPPTPQSASRHLSALRLSKYQCCKTLAAANLQLAGRICGPRDSQHLSRIDSIRRIEFIEIRFVNAIE
jgi:hypothetical protein